MIHSLFDRLKPQDRLTVGDRGRRMNSSLHTHGNGRLSIAAYWPSRGTNEFHRRTRVDEGLATEHMIPPRCRGQCMARRCKDRIRNPTPASSRLAATSTPRARRLGSIGIPRQGRHDLAYRRSVLRGRASCPSGPDHPAETQVSRPPKTPCASNAGSISRDRRAAAMSASRRAGPSSRQLAVNAPMDIPRPAVSG